MTSAATASWQRTIVHADMDAFYASVEQLDNPSLRGQPLIVGPQSRRGVVLTASYEARPFGVHSAMPMVDAMRKCPTAIVVPPRFSRYRGLSQLIMGVFREFSPKVEPLSLDEAFLDMSGAEGFFGPPEVMGRAIKAAVNEATQGLTVSVGISGTKYVAKVASGFAKPDGLTVIAQTDAKRWLSGMPVSALWGAGRKTQQRLEAAGYRTVGDVATASSALLEQSFGKIGLQFHRLANAVDPRAVVGDRMAKSISSERTFERDIRERAEIEFHLRRAADEVGRRLRREAYAAEGVRIKLKTTAFASLSRQISLPSSTQSSRVLHEAAVHLLPQLVDRGPFRLVGLCAFDLTRPDSPDQQGLEFDERTGQGKRLEEALDAVEERFGAGAVQRGASQLRTRHLGVSQHEENGED